MIPPRQHELYRALRDHLGWTRGDLAEAVAKITERSTPSVRTIEDYEKGKRQVASDPPLAQGDHETVRVIPDPWDGATRESYAAVLRQVQEAGHPFEKTYSFRGGKASQEFTGLVHPASDFAWDNPREQDEHGKLKRSRKAGEAARGDRVLARVAIDYALGIGLFGFRAWVPVYEVVRLLPGEGAKKRPKGGPSPFESYDPPIRFGGSLEDRDRADNHAATVGPDAVVLLRPRDVE